MLFFPKSEDTSDLKILINYEILTDIKRHGKLKTANIIENCIVNETKSKYDCDVIYSTITFDNQYIYSDNEPIALTDLLVNKIIPKSLMCDEILSILYRRNLNVKLISYNDEKADALGGKSFCKNYKYLGYLIISDS